MPTELEQLKGLGPKSSGQLGAVGIHTRDELEAVGPVQAFLWLKEAGYNPSLNFLYAMVGALNDVDWRVIARHEKERLLGETEDYEAIKSMLEGNEF